MVSPMGRKTGTTAGLSNGGESHGGDTGPAGDIARAEAWRGAFPSILPSVRPDGLTQQKPDDRKPWTVGRRATGERALRLETAVQQKFVLLEGPSPGSHGPLRNPTNIQRGLVCLDFLRKAATVSRFGMGRGKKEVILQEHLQWQLRKLSRKGQELAGMLGMTPHWPQTTRTLMPQVKDTCVTY